MPTFINPDWNQFLPIYLSTPFPIIITSLNPCFLNKLWRNTMGLNDLVIRIEYNYILRIKMLINGKWMRRLKKRRGRLAGSEGWIYFEREDRLWEIVWIMILIDNELKEQQVRFVMRWLCCFIGRWLIQRSWMAELMSIWWRGDFGCWLDFGMNRYLQVLCGYLSCNRSIFLIRFYLFMYSNARKNTTTADVNGECARLFESSSSAYSCKESY